MVSLTKTRSASIRVQNLITEGFQEILDNTGLGGDVTVYRDGVVKVSNPDGFAGDMLGWITEDNGIRTSPILRQGWTAWARLVR